MKSIRLVSQQRVTGTEGNGVIRTWTHVATGKAFLEECYPDAHYWTYILMHKNRPNMVRLHKLIDVLHRCEHEFARENYKPQSVYEHTLAP